jgi:hypothetical protein
VERFKIGGEKNRHGPAAAAGHAHHGGHVDPVDIGSLLPVDLDADEVLVQQLGGSGVGEGLPFHDLAPVAGRVSHRKEDRLVFRSGFGEGLLPPGIPVDRVFGVLQQVGTGFENQAVCACGGLLLLLGRPALSGEYPAVLLNEKSGHNGQSDQKGGREQEAFATEVHFVSFGISGNRLCTWLRQQNQAHQNTISPPVRFAH